MLDQQGCVGGVLELAPLRRLLSWAVLKAIVGLKLGHEVAEMLRSEIFGLREVNVKERQNLITKH